VYARVAADHGFRVEAATLQERFGEAWGDSLERSRTRGHECSDETLRDGWLRIVSRTFGDAVPASELPAIFNDLYERFVSPRAWTIVPGARDTFEMLRGRGLRLGILSNWDDRLRVTLERLELLPLFDLVVISHEVGFEKPHDAMFATALRLCGASPEHVLHVGDSFEADIRPARELGLRTFWVADCERVASAENAGPSGPSFAELSDTEWDTLLS
jgi:REG-2-like HAD superfamily hydrolase